jgi:hypothetical protein
MSTLREKRLRFTSNDDLCLLREVTAQNPIKEAKAWSTVQENIEKTMGKKFSIRTLKDHLQLLSEIYLKKDMVSQKKSGVEEIFSERDNLLQEISDLCKEFKKPRRTKINKVEQIVNFCAIVLYLVVYHVCFQDGKLCLPVANDKLDGK